MKNEEEIKCSRRGTSGGFFCSELIFSNLLWEHGMGHAIAFKNDEMR
jgi:hypothetical protein